MEKTRLFGVLTSDRKSHPYGLIPSLELEDRFPGARCVKITDSLFLTETEDGAVIYDEEKECCLPEEGLSDSDKLDGFITEISMAPDVILSAEFSHGKAVIGGEEFGISVKEVTEKMLLIRFGEKDVLFADISRFLLYGYAGGEFICGYIEV